MEHDYHQPQYRPDTMNAIAALQLALVLLPKITTGIVEFVAWIATLRRVLQQSGEWTADYEAQWREALLSRNILPEELPDAPHPDAPQAPV